MLYDSVQMKIITVSFSNRMEKNDDWSSFCCGMMPITFSFSKRQTKPNSLCCKTHKICQVEEFFEAANETLNWIAMIYSLGSKQTTLKLEGTPSMD
jgi:hypothetical protein